MVRSTRDRLLDVALEQFAGRGFEATSLDDVAAALGIRKQTILYYEPSKEALFAAVIRFGVGELSDVLTEAAARTSRRRASQAEVIVDALFRVGSTRPELLELVREALRLGPPAAAHLVEEAEPIIAALAVGVSREVVLTAAAMIVGMATEVDVLRGLGVDPTLGALRRRRRVVLSFVHDAAR